MMMYHNRRGRRGGRGGVPGVSACRHDGWGWPGTDQSHGKESFLSDSRHLVLVSSSTLVNHLTCIFLWTLYTVIRSCCLLWSFFLLFSFVALQHMPKSASPSSRWRSMRRCPGRCSRRKRKNSFICCPSKTRAAWSLRPWRNPVCVITGLSVNAEEDLGLTVWLFPLVVPKPEEEEEPIDQDELIKGWCGFSCIFSNATMKFL